MEMIPRLDGTHQIRVRIILPDGIQQLILRIFTECPRQAFMGQQFMRHYKRDAGRAHHCRHAVRIIVGACAVLCVSPD